MKHASLPLPTSGVDLFADDVLHDPYPALRELRDAGPAVRLTAYDAWVLPRYEHVRAALADHERFSSAHGVGYEDQFNVRQKGSVLASDPPDHTRLRAVLSEKLAPKALAKLRTRIAAIADDMVADTVVRGSFDAVTDLAALFPVTVVADLIGLPEDARDPLLTFADGAFNSFGPFNGRTAASLPMAAQLSEYLTTVMVRDNLRPDGWAAAVYEAADRGDIEASSVIPLLGAYVVAGMDTTINAIGNTILLFARHPQSYQELRADPSLLGSAFEESLRLESPAQGFFRRTTQPVDIEGVTVPADTKVLLSFASANRDDRKWERPEEFLVRRNPVDHVALGYGVHGCAGQGLARMEAHAVLGALVRQVSSVELAGEPVRKLNNVTRGLASLPVTVRTQGR
ncbi:cytochrome P450 [Streptomyces sp. NBC_00582]|uniref:cytochrome P450 n=1 Tax=Streptomyces sp. NBC_00582 TaxID=2975783 RepID=UPI002E7FC2A2|nr:cytochrome P450 [Streptomyces sp. NBC_00582]WUB66056.1 cytochrome P450 [Streptomyces sp. NBC_00582]